MAILGANGAGKTTLLNSIAGLIRPNGGSIRFQGNELVGLSAHRIVELGIATVPENRRLFEPMSVIENLELGAYTARARAGAAATLERIFDLFPRLAERRRQTVRTMSGGERQMVAIGRALMAQAGAAAARRALARPVAAARVGAVRGAVAHRRATARSAS